MVTRLNKSKDKENSSDPNKKDDDTFCSVMNPLTGQFIDLSQLSLTPNQQNHRQQRQGKNGKNKKQFDSTKTRWLVKGFESDLGKNFTISVCSSPVVTDEDMSQLSNNTGAFYSVNNTSTNSIDLVSIGDFSTKPILFGTSNNKKLTLQYDNGSLCPNKIDRKSTLLSFVCDKEIQQKAQISYIGNLHNCSYFFEVRSIYACPTSNKTNEINVMGIFFGIISVFVFVELFRRWIKRKMVRMSSRSQSFSRSSSNMYNIRDTDSNNIVTSSNATPHWEFFEEQSIAKKLYNKLRQFASNSIGNHGTSLGGHNTQYPGSLGMHSASQSSFFRDMETQNDILDSLDNTSNNNNGSMVSSSASNLNAGN